MVEGENFVRLVTHAASAEADFARAMTAFHSVALYHGALDAVADTGLNTAAHKFDVANELAVRAHPATMRYFVAAIRA